MKVQEVMERAGTTQSGRAIAYIKDALEEIELLFETNISYSDISLVKDQRLYDMPATALKVVSVSAKNHLNTKDEYRSIHRLLNEPIIRDKD